MMIAIGVFLAIIILLQIFILVGICRKNYKLNEIDARVLNLNDLLVTGMTKKKHKKKKEETFYADNESES